MPGLILPFFNGISSRPEGLFYLEGPSGAVAESGAALAASHAGVGAGAGIEQYGDVRRLERASGATPSEPPGGAKPTF